MRRVFAGIAFLVTLAAGAAGALERVARPILDIDAPEDESRVEEWRSSCNAPISYYNVCPGWTWVWSGGDEPMTIFGVLPCDNLPTTLSRSVLRMADPVPAGYGYTGSIAIQGVDVGGCPAGEPIAQQPFLPTVVPWTIINWNDVEVPHHFAVVVRESPVTHYAMSFVSDRPAAGRSGLPALGGCVPDSRPTRSFFHASTDTSCTLTPLFDGVGQAEWMWICNGTFQPGPPLPPAFVTLTTTANGDGTVLPPSGMYPPGTEVTLLAIPDSGSVFEDWWGSGFGSYSGNDNPRTITLIDHVIQVAHFVSNIQVSFLSEPTGMRLLLDGVEETMPLHREWPPNSVHDVAVDSLVVEAPSARVRFIEWGDGVTSLHRTYQVPVFGPVSVTARFNREFRIEVASSNGGTTVPPPEWAVEGSQHSILAIPDFGYEFVAWAGSGAGSYSGPANPATITALGPIHETPIFEPTYAGNGSDFTISASDVDAHVTSSPATGTIRSLHLWLTCSDRGISAFEANVTGSLTPLGFSPAPGVLNVGTADHLLLAVGGCPNGAPSPVRLGEWLLIDDGGTICLSSEPSGVLATVDCDVLNPSLWADPRVEGFASDGSAPCVVGNNACAGTPIFPTPVAEIEMPTPLATRIIAMRPNPFTRECRVEYSLARDATVRLDVFDVSGRRVRTLASGNVSAGVGVEVWDGRNDEGGHAPGGVYFVMLDAGGVRETKKIVYLSGRD